MFLKFSELDRRLLACFSVPRVIRASAQLANTGDVTDPALPPCANRNARMTQGSAHARGSSAFPAGARQRASALTKLPRFCCD
ncbi:hypothetical protein QQF64_020184 [Cirrhinus molitorella]|uniref:Uncharacterized protein n=1 Tax=Cirrhinus molitorella TaxID=172907 RepID=A0ABR3LBW2_9TELE